MKLFYKEDGQSVVIIAVSIALIILIGLGVYNFSEVLNAKAKFRNLSDSTSLAGTLVQTKGIYSWFGFNNVSPLVVTSYQTYEAFKILASAAGYLVAKTTTYDLTATRIKTTAQKNIYSNLETIIKTISSTPKTPTNLETVNTAFLYEVLSFYEIDGLIIAKEISDLNKTLFASSLNNCVNYSLPSEFILLRRPILFATDSNNLRYKYRTIIKNSKIVVKYHNDTENIDVNSGFFSVSICNTPTTFFQRILPILPSTKQGKLVTFSNSCPYMDTSTSSEVILLDKVNGLISLFEQTNTTNNNLVTHMSNNSNNLTTLKSDWNLIVANYNSLYQYIINNNLLSYFKLTPKSDYYSSSVFASLKGLNLLNIQDYKNIASTKGLNISSQTDIEKFYKTLTLKDIFQTSENMKSIINQSFTSYSNDRGLLITNMTNLMTKLRVFNSSYNSGANVPTIFNNYVLGINNNVTNSTLTNFLNLVSTIRTNINLSYGLINDFNTNVNFRSTYNLNLLNPSDDFYTNLNYFFNIPLVRFEGS
jgi:hypothetical protein